MPTQTPEKRKLFASTLRKLFLGVLVGILGFVVLTGADPGKTAAATSDTLNFQAKLMSSSGAIAADGNYNVEFKLYSASTGGSALWTEDYLNSATQGVRVVNGYLTVNLGSITPFPGTINWDQNLYIGMTVRGTGSCSFGACSPTDAEMTPRLKLTATPFALSAGNLAGVSAGGFRSTLTFQGATGGDQSFQIPDLTAAGSDIVCLKTLANCTGTGGGIAGSGSQYYLSKFDTIGGNHIANSSLYDNGSFLGLGTTSNNGLLSIVGSNAAQSSIFVQSAASASVPTIVVKQAASQTGDLFQLQDNSGNINGAFSSVGNQLSLGRVAASGTVTQGKIVFADGTTDNRSITLQVATQTSASATLTIPDLGGVNSTVALTNDSTNFIRNQTGVQASSNFNISATGIAGTSFLTPLLDTPSGTTVLNIGTNNASGGINLNQSTTLAAGKNFVFGSGAGGFDQSASSGTFKTGTGAVSINGDTTLAANKGLAFTSGSGNFDQSGSTGFFKTGTGAVTLNGATTANAGITVTNGGNVAFQKTTDYSTTGSANNVSFGTGALVRLTGASAQTITGISGGVDGRILTIVNAGSSAATLKNNDTTDSSAANVIITGTGTDATLPAGASITLVYDSGASLWRVTGSLAGSGGVSTVGAVSATPTANGATITGNTLNLAVADGTNAGLLSTVGQTIGGAKTFSALITGNAGITTSGGAVSLQGNAASNLSTTVGALTLDAAAAVNVGTTNATSVSIGKAGATTTVNGALTAVQLLTGQAGITTSGGAVSLTGNAASSLTTTSGLLTLQGAGGVSITSTNTTVSSGVTIQSGNSSAGTAGTVGIDTGTSSSGTSAITIGNTNAGSIAIGHAGITTTLAGNIVISNLAAASNNAVVCLNGTSQLATCTNSFEPTTGTTDFIRNQSTVQSSSNFNISTTGTAGVSFLTPLLDTPSGTTALNIGTTNASGGINLNQTTTILGSKSLIFGSGAGNFDQSASTGTFATGTGAVTFNGNTNVVSGKSLGINNSSAANPFAINTLTTAQPGYQAAIGTGSTTNNGLVIQGVASQSASTNLLNIQSSAGAGYLVVTGTGATSVSNGFYLVSAAVQGTSSLISKTYNVGTGGVATSDVVVLANDGGTARAVDSATAYDTRVLGVALTGVASGNPTNVAISGVTTVNYTGTAPAIGDQLVVSTTSGAVKVDNNATAGILGYATTAGSAGTVGVRIQITSGQASPVFQGNVTANSFLTTLLDTPSSGGTLAIGTTNATGGININQSTTIAANKNITFASGTGSFDQHNSSGTFQTGTGAVSLNGATTANSGITITNSGSLSTKAASDYTTIGAQSDVNLGTASLVRLNGASAQTINSITGGTDGRILTIVNAGSTAATIKNNGGGTAGNLVVTGTGNDISLPTGATITLIYDTAATVWRVSGSVATTVAPGVSTVGTFSSTSIVNGASISGTTLTLGVADATNVGLVSTVAQSIQGLKTFNSGITAAAINGTAGINTVLGNATGTFQLVSSGGLNVATNGDLTGVRSINSGSGNFQVTSGGAVTAAGLITGNAGLTSSGGAISLTGNAASSLTTTSGGLTIDTTSTAGQTIAIGNGNITHAIAIGTGTAAQTITIGSTTAGSTTTISGAGASGISLNGNTVVSGSNTFATGTGAVSLNGTTTLAANQDLVYAIGAGKFDMHNSTGTFQTGTGNVSINGTTTVAANQDFSFAAGTSAFNDSLSTGSFKTSTGNNFLNGNTTLAANKDLTYAAGTGAFDQSASTGSFKTSTGGVFLNGNTTVAATKSISFAASSTGDIDQSNSSGQFRTGTGSVFLNGNTTIAAGKNITLASGAGTITQNFVGIAGGDGFTSVVNNSVASGSSTVNAHTITLSGTNTTGTNRTIGVNFTNVTNPGGTNNFTGLNFGTGFTDILRYNSTQLISGTGLIQNAALDNTLTYSNITGVGALVNGSIASGFGTIATSNTITGTVLNGTTSINTGAGAGTARIDSSGNLTNIGTITATGTAQINVSGTAATSIGNTTGAFTIQGGSTSVIKATSGANTTTIDFTTPTANVTLNVPALTAGTYNICTDSGNCAGAGATLQTSYNNSIGGATPEVKLDSTRGALTIQDADTTIGATANLFEVLNAGGGTNLFKIQGNGNVGIGTSGNPSALLSVGTGTGAFTVNSSGNIITSGTLTVNNASSFNGIITVTGQSDVVQAKIKANGTQTNDLQQFTANNGTTVYSGFDNLGNFYEKDQGNGFTGKITIPSANFLTGNVVLTLPQVSGEICTTSGNCSGVGGTGNVLNGGQPSGSLVVGTATSNVNTAAIDTNGVNRVTFDTSSNAFFGNGITAAAPTATFTLQGTGSTTNNTAGTNLTVAGGLGSGGTGSNGGVLNLQGGAAGGSSSHNGGAVAIAGGAAASGGTQGAVTIQGSSIGLTGTTNINTSGSAATNIGGGSAGAITLQSNGAINSTAGADSIISTTSSHTLSLVSQNFNLSAAGVITLAGNQSPADITTATAATASNISIQPGISTAASGVGANLNLSAGNQSGTTAAIGGSVNILGGNASGVSGTRIGGNVSIDAGTGSSSANNGSISIGTTNASSISEGRTGITTTNNGALTVTQLLTGNAGATIGGGAIALTGNTASSLTTSSGALTLTSAAAATWGTSAGNLTLQAGSGTVSLGTSTNLTANGALSISSGGATALSLDAGGAAALNLGTGNASSVSISKSGVTTTVNGALTASQLLTASSGLTISTGSTFTNASSTLNTALALGNFNYTGSGNTGSIGTAASTVDTHTAFTITQTTAGQALTIPAPTDGAAGRNIQIISSTSSTQNFTIAGVTITPGIAVSYIYNGSAWVANSSNSGVNIVGSLVTGTASPSANGATITGNTIYLQSASSGFAGLVDTNSQTFSGLKTFSSLLTGQAGASITGGALTLTGNAASSLTTSSGALTLTSAAAATWGTSAGDLTVQANGASNLNLTTSGAGTVNVGTTNATALNIGNTGAAFVAEGSSTVNLFNGATAHTVQLATGAAVQSVTIGSTNSTSSLTLQAGTGNINIGNDTVAKTTTINIGADNIGADVVAIGSNNASSTLNLDAGTGATALQIGNSTSAHNILIGAGATTNAQNVTIGSAGNNTGRLILQGGTGTGTPAISLATGVSGGTAGTISIGNTGAVTQEIDLGTNSTAASTTNVFVGSTQGGVTTLQSAGGTTVNSNTTVSNGKNFIINSTASTGTFTMNYSSPTNNATSTIINAANGASAGTVTVNAVGINLSGTNTAGANTTNGLNFANIVTPGTGTQTYNGLNFGTGYTNLITSNNFSVSAAGVLQGASATLSGANALTLGLTGTSSGAIVFKGATAASGQITLVGPTNPSTSNYTLSIPAISGNATICTTDAACSVGASNYYLQQVPTANSGAGSNLIAPTAAGITALIVNATTAAGGGTTAAIINQFQNSEALRINNSGTNNSLDITTTGNPAVGNALIFANNNAGTPSGNLLELQNRGTDKFTVDASGNVVALGSLTAGSTGQFQVAGASGDVTNTGKYNTNTFNTNTLTFGTAGATAVGLTQAAASTAGGNLTITAGQSGAGAAATNGGDLILQGGAVGASSTGVQGTVKLSTTVFTSSAGNQSFGAGGGTVTQASVDGNSTIEVSETVAGPLTVIIPAPITKVTGRLLYVTISGSNAVTIAPSGGTSFTMNPNTGATLVWNTTTNGWVNAGADGGSNSYIQNQTGSNQTASFRISGTGQITNTTATTTLSLSTSVSPTTGVIVVNDTSGTGTDNLINLQGGGTSKFAVNANGVATFVGGQTADITTSGATTLKLDTGGSAAITVGGTNASQINIGHGTIATAITGNVGITNTNATTSLNVSSNTTPTTALVVVNDTSGVATDKLLALQAGGVSKFTVDASGNVVTGSGAGTGSVTNNGATINTPKVLTDFATGGSIGTAASTVDIYTTVAIRQTTGGQTLTIPDPTTTSNYGKVLYVSNIGTSSFVVAGQTTNKLNATPINAGTTATLIWSNTDNATTSAWTFAGADGSAILNQNTTTQTANFKINGTGQADGGIIAPSLERASAGTLTLGSTANSTAISIGSANAVGASALVLDSGASSTITVGSSANARTVNIGNVASTAQTIVIGSNTNTTSSTTIQGGNSSTSAIVLQTGNNGATAGGITIGNTTGAFTQAIAIGTNATASSTTNVTIGSTIAGTTTIQSAGGTSVNSSSTTNALTITGTGNPSGGTNATIVVNNNATTPSGNLLALQNKGTNKFTVDVNGNVVVGSGVGTGSVTNNGATVNTVLNISSATGVFGSNTTTVDVYTAFAVSSLAGINQVFTIPAPTANTTYGRIIYVTNVGTNTFTFGNTYLTASLKSGATASLVWSNVNSVANWTYAGSDAGGVFNQTSQQTGANFNIDGIGIAGNFKVTPGTGVYDVASAGALNIGTSTATSIIMGSSTSTANTLQSSGTTRVQSTSDNVAAFAVSNTQGANILTVDDTNTSGGANLATNGGAESGTTNWTLFGTSTVTQDLVTTEVASGTASIKAAVTAANSGAKYNVSLTSGQVYDVSFSVKSSSGIPTFSVFYSTNGTSSAAACAAGSYDSASVATKFVKYTCTFTATTTASAYVVISQTDATTRNLFIDNLSVVATNSTGTQNTGIIKIGGANSQGLVLFQLDTYAGTPFTGTNQSLAGAMYFDTTAGKMQCYDGTVWGACGAAPNSNVTLTPEYAGAVLNGTGIGTLTSDFCGNGGGLSTNIGFCASGEARDFYKWTSVQPSYQNYSLYVTYKLPSTFKAFVGNASLTGRVDNTTNAGVNYSVYRSTGSGITQCGGGATPTNVVGWNPSNSTANPTVSTWQAATINPATSCAFAANDYVIFKIDVVAQNSGSAFVENLNFSYSNQ